MGGRWTTCLWVLGWWAAGAWGQILTGFAPTHGQPGTWVTVQGSGLYYSGTLVDPVVAVQFGSRPANFQVTADNQLVAVVPEGASTDFIRVAKAGRDWVYSPQVFTVIGPGPYILGFSPTHGSAGTPVRIEGLQFVGVTGVWFGGGPAPGFFVESETSIRVNGPTGAVTGPIRVERAGVGAHESADWFYLPPVIESAGPTNGRPGTLVTLRGQNFLGATGVEFSGVPAAFEPPQTNQVLQVLVPTGAVTGPIRVTTPGGTFVTAWQFVVPPTLMDFEPPGGPPGTEVVLRGANLNAAPVEVWLGGVPVTVRSLAFDRLVVEVPSGAVTAPFTVVTRDGSDTGAALFHLPPEGTGMFPQSGPPGTMVTVAGRNLLGTTAVSFGGVPAMFLPAESNTNLVAFVPEDVLTGPLEVTTPGGSADSGELWFYGPPRIETVTPGRGVAGAEVVLTGRNFLGVTAVRFSGVAAAFESPTNHALLRVTVPAGAETGPVEVVTPGGVAVWEGPFVVERSSDLKLEGPSGELQTYEGRLMTVPFRLLNLGPDPAMNGVMEVTWSEEVLRLENADVDGGTVEKEPGRATVRWPLLAAGTSVELAWVWSAHGAGLSTNRIGLISQHGDPTPGDARLSWSVVVEALPRLGIELLPDGKVRLSWAGTFANYRLEHRPVEAGEAPWAEHPIQPDLKQGRWEVVTPLEAGGEWFRLVRNGP